MSKRDKKFYKSYEKLVNLNRTIGEIGSPDQGLEDISDELVSMYAEYFWRVQKTAHLGKETGHRFEYG